MASKLETLLLGFNSHNNPNYEKNELIVHNKRYRECSRSFMCKSKIKGSTDDFAVKKFKNEDDYHAELKILK
jgi:hypothetical protein